MSKKEELKNVSNNMDFVDMEKKVMELWKEQDIEKKYVRLYL